MPSEPGSTVDVAEESLDPFTESTRKPRDTNAFEGVCTECGLDEMLPVSTSEELPAVDDTTQGYLCDCGNTTWTVRGHGRLVFARESRFEQGPDITGSWHNYGFIEWTEPWEGDYLHPECPVTQLGSADEPVGCWRIAERLTDSEGRGAWRCPWHGHFRVFDYPREQVSESEQTTLVTDGGTDTETAENAGSCQDCGHANFRVRSISEGVEICDGHGVLVRAPRPRIAFVALGEAAAGWGWRGPPAPAPDYGPAIPTALVPGSDESRHSRSYTRIRVWAAFRANPNAVPKDLLDDDSVGVTSPGNMYRVLDELEADGFLERKPFVGNRLGGTTNVARSLHPAVDDPDQTAVGEVRD